MAERRHKRNGAYQMAARSTDRVGKPGAHIPALALPTDSASHRAAASREKSFPAARNERVGYIRPHTEQAHSIRLTAIGGVTPLT